LEEVLQNELNRSKQDTNADLQNLEVPKPWRALIGVKQFKINMLIKLNDENMEKTGVYKITNPVNNEFYIGSASLSFAKRFLNHRRLLKFSKNPCSYLQKAYNKNKNVDFIFEILEVCNKEECIKKEQFYLDTLNPKYNLCKIAGSSLGRKASDQQKIKFFQSIRAFSDKEIITMFDLYNRGIKVKEIAQFINCKPNNVSCILNKDYKYKFVKEKYNLKLKNKKTVYNGRFLITKPNGEQVIVENLTKFAEENNLCAANLNKCSNGIFKTSKGHKVEKIDKTL
jgi:group I intron endonuclease